MEELRLYEVTHRGKKVRDFSHADMLRHDRGFCNPKKPHLVVFPRFRMPDRRYTPERIDNARWDSFGMKVTPIYDLPAVDFHHWTTYVQLLDRLAPVTYDEWLAASPGFVLVGSRV